MEKNIKNKNKIEDNKEEKKLNIEELKKNLEKYQKLKNEYLACWQKERADFLNYKKEELLRMGEVAGYASTDLILKIIPILDNFKLAEKNISPEMKDNEEIKGLLQIKDQLEDFLKKQGVEEIESIGKKFDINLHEAVEELEVKGKEPGIVVEEVKKGYKMRGRIIRIAKVKVSK